MDYAQFSGQVTNKPTLCCHRASLVPTCQNCPNVAPGFWSLGPLPYTLDTLHLPIKYHESLKSAPPQHQPDMTASEKTETGSPFSLLFLTAVCVVLLFQGHSGPSKVLPSSTWKASPKSRALRHTFSYSWKIPPENSFREDSCSWPTLPASLLKGRQ